MMTTPSIIYILTLSHMLSLQYRSMSPVYSCFHRSFRLSGENQIVSLGSGEETFIVPPNQLIHGNKGDLVGIRFGDDVDVLHYDDCCEPDTTVLLSLDTVSTMYPNSVHAFHTPDNDGSCRLYSITAFVATQ